MPSKPAPLTLRIAALAYDAFPLVALWMLATAIALAAARGEVDVAHPPALYRLVLQLVLGVLTGAYFTLSWTFGGQTIGMRAWRLRVTADDGTRLPWMRACVRFVFALVSLAVFGLGFAWALFDGERRTWHDRVARSRMSRLG